MTVETRSLDIVVHRGISGVRPLWWTSNLGVGRWHGPHQPRPVQYTCPHPMGPLAELARHAGALTPELLRQLRRHVFALRVHLESVLELDFSRAEALGLAAADLVGPPDSYISCGSWLDGTLRSRPEIDGLLVPSAALPGTQTLVVIGKRHPFPYDRAPRRAVDVPCAAAALNAHPVTTLGSRIVPLESKDHPSLLAWREGRDVAFEQPRAAA
jgi:hypothetical protein